MNPEDLQKTIQILEKAEHIALLVSQETTADIFAAAEVAAEIFSAKGKRVGFFVPPAVENALHPEIYTALKHPPILLKEFIIALDTAKSPVSQLRYERETERLNIILSPKTQPLSQEFVSFREGKTLCDCVVTLGIEDIEALNTVYSSDAPLFTETPLINIDIHEKNTRYGEANIVLPEKTSLSELAYEFFVAVYKEPLTSAQATILLSGIMQETDGFKSPRTNADTLLTASELARLGANHIEAYALAKSHAPIGLIQLFGRASVRSKLDQEQGIVWSFLTTEDFEKTERTSSDIPQVLLRLKSEFTSERLCILLWQEFVSNEVSGIISGTKDALEALQKHTGGVLNHASLQIGRTFSTFKEAEEFLSALLKEIV